MNKDYSLTVRDIEWNILFIPGVRMDLFEKPLGILRVQF